MTNITVNVPLLLIDATILFVVFFVMLLAAYAICLMIGATKNLAVDQYRRYAFNKMMNEAVWK